MSKNKSVLSKDEVVVTSSYVVSEKLPILLVSHERDEEGDVWQFHCGNGDYDMEKMLLVEFRQLLERDCTLVDIENLPVNSTATRASLDDKWIIIPDK